MRGSGYTINKGVNAPVEFRGLRGQYIYQLGIGIAALLVGFVLLYLTGVPAYGCLSIVLGGGTYLFRRVYRDNAKFGVDGRMKQRARRQMPAVITNHSRTVFIHLCK